MELHCQRLVKRFRDFNLFYSISMPRLLAADKCPKCRGPMTRQTTTAGTIFVCEKCDADDPIKGADKWVKGELRPPE
jgi:hypothetical protein